MEISPAGRSLEKPWISIEKESSRAKFHII